MRLTISEKLRDFLRKWNMQTTFSSYEFPINQQGMAKFDRTVSFINLPCVLCIAYKHHNILKTTIIFSF